jgi:hypothetical protein
VKSDEPGGGGRPAETVVEGRGVAAKAALLEGDPGVEPLTRMSAERPADGPPDSGAREGTGVDQPAAPTCAYPQRLGEGRTEGDGRPAGAQPADANARHRDTGRDGPPSSRGIREHAAARRW